LGQREPSRTSLTAAEQCVRCGQPNFISLPGPKTAENGR
jgi:hypothetical protein